MADATARATAAATAATLPPQRITQEAIEAARLEFLRLAAQDGEVDHVVIARDVTVAELCTVPREWFDAVKIALLTDGSLVITEVKTRMYNAITAALARQFRNAGLSVRIDKPEVLADGSVMTPSLSVGPPNANALAMRQRRRGRDDEEDGYETESDEHEQEPRTDA